MRPIDHLALGLMGAGWIALPGCLKPARPTPLPALPQEQAERIVDANASRIGGTLRAIGSVDGWVTDDQGVRRRFSLDGVLFYLRPSYLRFDLKKFGDRQVLLGSNADQYWIYGRQEDSFHCGVHGDEVDPPADFPIRPSQLIDALGLGPIADAIRPDTVGRVQRIEEQTQQLLFLIRHPSGATVIEKEYWLDRFAPRLIRRVIFRDQDGALEMESLLGDYRGVVKDGPMLPYRMRASWPRVKAGLTFTIAKWSVHPALGPADPQFSTPNVCLTNGG